MVWRETTSVQTKKPRYHGSCALWAGIYRFLFCSKIRDFAFIIHWLRFYRWDRFGNGICDARGGRIELVPRQTRSCHGNGGHRIWTGRFNHV